MENLKSFNELFERLDEVPTYADKSTRIQHDLDRETQTSKQEEPELRNDPPKPTTNEYKEDVLATDGNLDALISMVKSSDDAVEVYKTILSEYPDYAITQEVIEDPETEENSKIIALGKIVKDTAK